MEDQQSESFENLKVLLNKASVYSGFLAENLNEDERKIKQFDQPSLITGGVLRDYQLRGVQWLVSLYENGLNGILADEMGLGKTLQTISLIAYLTEKKVSGPFLIVAPLSTLNNWMNEFERFCPSIPVCFYHGSIEERKAIRKTFAKGLDVLITSYEMILNDKKYLSKLNWTYIIVDEGHRLKNFNCKLVRELHNFNSSNRLLLTGTPLQNNLTELWSLLNFLLPSVFSSLSTFLHWFEYENDNEDETKTTKLGKAKLGNEANEYLITSLHKILKPFLLRRLKSDVESNLPRKKEYLVYAPMSAIQKDLYDAALKKDLRGFLHKRQKKNQESMSNKNLGSLMNVVMQLRKICNHPFLFNAFYSSNYSLSEVINASGKMKLLDELLTELIKRGHKVLIFSQMTLMLDVIETYLSLKKIDFYRIDGNVQQSERQQQIKDFNGDKGSCSVFLLSTRAGGLGINLTSADSVIIYDSDWNPQMDLQAQDRVHRIGQTKPVIVYRFCIAHSIESYILEKASDKRVLEKIVIQKGKFRGDNYTEQEDSMTLAELAQAINDEEPENIEAINYSTKSKILSKPDLERLLDRSDKAMLRKEQEHNKIFKAI